MTVATTEMESQVSQLGAGRDSEAASVNAARLDNWKRRYPHDVVDVPITVDPPKWPALRSSIQVGTNVTKISARKGARG